MEEFERHFPFRDADGQASLRPQQRALVERIVAKSGTRALAQAPTGIGKTAIGVTLLRIMAERGLGPRFYVTTTKTQVDAIAREYPDDFVVMYGRDEYGCDYYVDQGVMNISAAQSPCYMLDCPHRVDQDTGQTKEPGVKPCEYYEAKFDALKALEQGKSILCTTAFYFHNRFLVHRWQEMEPALVVFDECHNLAQVTRTLFSHRLTDYHLHRIADAVAKVDPKQAKVIKRFVGQLKRIAHQYPSRKPVLLKDKDIIKLMEILMSFNSPMIEAQVRQMLKDKELDAANWRELKWLQDAVLSLPNFLRRIQYALKDEPIRNVALNYLIASYFNEDDPEVAQAKGTKRVRTTIEIQSYYVAGIIRKVAGANTIAYSATLPYPDIWMNETGLNVPFVEVGSSFNIDNTRIYMPTDTLHCGSRAERQNVSKSLKLVAQTAKRFAVHGHRSLVVVISETQRRLFLKHADNPDHRLDVVTYDEFRNARQAAEAFKNGEGDVLLGTAAQYAEGTDLPDGLAPVIFFLKPGFAPPDDPMAQFEKKRKSSGGYWALQYMRVMTQALQVRGRNIRSATDVGVTFFISQQFRGFVFKSLPKWLQNAYRGSMDMEKCIEDALDLLNTPSAPPTGVRLPIINSGKSVSDSVPMS